MSGADREAGRYDYLIVGAGFAGSVLAERLASQHGARILLIDRIQWRDGWPFVGTPSNTAQAAPLA